jgi:hypothetical protein
MSRIRLSLFLALALGAAACSGGGGQRVSGRSSVSNGSTGHVVREIQSPLASGFAAVDWPIYGRKFFNCLPPSGQIWDQFLPVIRYADVTGDGIPDAVVEGACPSSTSPNPAMVIIFSGASPATRPAEIGRLPEGKNYFFASMDMTLKGAVITLSGLAYGPTARLCCPNLDITLAYRWRAGRFVRVSRAVKPLQGG